MDCQTFLQRNLLQGPSNLPLSSDSDLAIPSAEKTMEMLASSQEVPDGDSVITGDADLDRPGLESARFLPSKSVIFPSYLITVETSLIFY